jgi:hypothetical protein
MLMDDHKTKQMGAMLKFLTRYAIQYRTQAQHLPLVSSPKKTSWWEKVRQS